MGTQWLNGDFYLGYNRPRGALDMTDQESSSARKWKHVSRRVLEALTAAALLAVALYWPSTTTGRLYLVILVAVLLVGLSLLRKWPSV